MGRSFVQLSLDERRVIARMHEKKISQAEIARTLRRDRSTICRELRRNFSRDREAPVAEGYWHVTAHAMAADRRRKYRRPCALPLSSASRMAGHRNRFLGVRGLLAVRLPD